MEQEHTQYKSDYRPSDFQRFEPNVKFLQTDSHRKAHGDQLQPCEELSQNHFKLTQAR